MQSLLRNERWSYFKFVAQGTIYALGGVNIGRDNITVEIQKGCKLIGRYDDPSIPNSTVSQAGGFIVLAHYIDPDNGQFVPYLQDDTRVTPPIENVNIILDGELSTEYNDIHSQKNNNVAISIVKGLNCSIKGSGGIGRSDHRGAQFEGIGAPPTNKGGSVNCHIDIGYSNNVVNNHVMIAGDDSAPSLCTIKVGSVGYMLSGGYNNPIIARVSERSDFEVTIGRFIGDNIVKPSVVAAFGARTVELTAGIIKGAGNLIYSNGTWYPTVKKIGAVYNTPVGIVRGEAISGNLLGVTIKNIGTTDSQFSIIYSDQNNPGPFSRLDITDNNFAGVNSGLVYFGGKNPAALPIVSNIRDNIPPVAGMANAIELNLRTSGITGNLATVGASSEAINYKSPDWLYGKLSVCVQYNGVDGACEIDLRSRAIVSLPVTYTAGDYKIVTTISGSTITLTPTGGAVMVYAFLHN